MTKLFSVEEQSYEIISGLDRKSLLEIEKVARVCTKTEHLIKDGSDEKLVSKLLNNEHMSSIEFGSDINVKFNIDRGLSHELVRHRLCSFQQKCIVGSSMIKTGTKGKTISIESLYKRNEGLVFNGKTHNKTVCIKSVNKNNQIVNNKISNVYYNGICPVYTLKTKQGYEITATKNHRFLLKTGKYKRLKNIKIGDKIMVNGVFSAFKIKDAELKKLYLEDLLSPIEIAEKINCSYGVVTYNLKRIGIFIPRKNDNNKEKYTKNHTKESYKKTSETQKKQFQNGRVTWNKGITLKDYPNGFNRVKESSYKNGRKEKNSNWNFGKISDKTGYSRTHLYSKIKEKDICQVCKIKKAKHLHHIDRNPKNWESTNILKVCINCHEKLHHGWEIGKIVHEDEVIEIKYSGKEKVYDLEMKAPNHNYIANGIVVHNSQRYVNDGKDLVFIRPFLCSQDVIGDWEKLDRPIAMDDYAWLHHCFETARSYKKLIRNGWSPEYARSVLPNATKTEIFVKTNLRDWINIFILRCSNKAHPQLYPLMRNLLSDFYCEIPVLFDDLYYNYLTMD